MLDEEDLREKLKGEVQEYLSGRPSGAESSSESDSEDAADDGSDSVKREKFLKSHCNAACKVSSGNFSKKYLEVGRGWDEEHVEVDAKLYEMEDMMADMKAKTGK